MTGSAVEWGGTERCGGCRCGRSGVGAPQRWAGEEPRPIGDRRDLVLALAEAMAPWNGPDADQVPGLVAPVAVLLDIDDFRRVNDAFGFAVGDRVIEALARALRRAAHPDDVVAHLVGSSFGVCCAHLRADELEAYVEHLRAALAEPIDIDGHRVTVRTSVGCARPDTTGLADDLLQQADLALSRAKELGGDRICAYDEGLRARVLRGYAVEALVRRATFLEEVELAYQPILELDERSIVGAEALLRLTDDEGTLVPALEAIELAERTGLMVGLGALILRTACREAARWQQELPERFLTVSVNVSARQLEDDHLPELVAAVLAETGLDPARLCLEVTETVLMADTDRSVRLLSQLKALGVAIAADDFGTGYCSLAYLKRFPLDAVKADLSFVAGLPHSSEDVAVVAAIMGIARALGLRVVAEGVEQFGQLDELDRLGCGFGQGHLWSRAVSGSAFTALAQRSPLVWGSDPRHRAARLVADEAVDVGPRRPLPAASIDLALRSLAHELRSPLTVVSGYASLLPEGAPDLDVIRGELLRAVGRMDRLISQLDDVRAADEGRLALDRTDVDLVDLAERAVAEVSNGSSVPIGVVRPVFPLAPVAVDRDRIEQVLINLLSNAVKHTPTGGRVELWIEGGDDWVEVAVSDDGPGVSPEQADLIFRKYGRVDHSRPGSGLGLFLARSIARAHGGDVVHRARLPKGSTFTLRVPTVAFAASPDRTAERPADGDHVVRPTAPLVGSMVHVH